MCGRRFKAREDIANAIHQQMIRFTHGVANTESLVYAERPQTLDHLEDNIRRVITDIRPQMLEKVIENWTSD
ncbi:hypothetical protein TNCV_1323291 [Trichonephila clavipes]|nr:hypothetical protein TNCV_1323291 [Trichonephila clavipes]